MSCSRRSAVVASSAALEAICCVEAETRSRSADEGVHRGADQVALGARMRLDREVARGDARRDALIAAGVALLLTRAIVGPVGQMMRAADGIAEGDFLREQSDDERLRVFSRSVRTASRPAVYGSRLDSSVVIA